jgi:polysaccharide biosynthesis transport protein
MERLPGPQEPPIARSYLEILRKYKWLLITTSLAGAIVAAISSFRAIPVYRASAKLLIERAAPQVVKVPEVLPTEAAETSDYYPTQYGILKSLSLAREVVTKLELQRHPEFVGTPGEKSFDPLGSIRGRVRGVLEGLGIAPAARLHAAVPSRAGVQEHQVVAAFVGRLQVEPVRNSRLVTVSFEGRDPALIAQIVNTLAEAYMNRTIDLKINATQTATQWLRNKVGEERKKIEQAEWALQAFRERENVLSPQGGEEILVKKIAMLNDLYVQTRVKRLEMDSQTQMLQRIAKDPKLVEAFPLVMQNQVIQTLKANSASLQLNLMELSDRYDFKHPALKQKEAQLTAMKGNVHQGIEQIRQSVEMQSQLARAMEEYVQKLLDETKREVFAFNQKAIQYGVLQREVQAQEEIYNLLVKRLHETGVTDQIRVGNASLIDPAEVPTVPVKPRQSRDTLFGLLVGCGVGLCIAWGLTALDTAIHTPDDLKQDLDFPLLGSIARFRLPQEERGRVELIVQARPHSPEAEVFRAVRTSIMAARSELPSKALLLTSVTPQEGKTLVTANLAVALAQAGRKVLLVDADMRKPRLGKLLHTCDAGPGLEGPELVQLPSNGASLDGATRPADMPQSPLGKLARIYDEGPGLAQLLRGDASLDEVTHPTAVEHLSLIPCPTPAAYPSELLESERLAAFIASAKEHYDFVLFDSPPLMAVTDAAVLASRVDGVVLVVKSDAIPREQLRQALTMLADVKATVVGGVLNMVDVHRNHSYHMYAYKY